MLAHSPWLALDIETSGLSPTRDRVDSVGVISADGRETLVTTSLADTRFRRRMARADFLVAHNARFDLAFVAEAWRRIPDTPSLRAYCTLELARALLPNYRRYDLASLCQALNLEDRPNHTAEADARAVAGLFRYLIGRGGLDSERALAEVHGPAFEMCGRRARPLAARS